MATTITTSMKDLTVCIVSYNTRDLLRRCLRSIEAARGILAVEIVVADNDSHDGTVEMLRDEFSAIPVLANSDNKGYAAAANQCLRVVQGRYVCMLNPDAYVFPDTLTAMLHLMDTRPDIGVASCLTQDNEGKTCPTARHGSSVFNALLHAFAIPALLPSEAFVRKYMGWFLGRYFFQYKTQLRDCEPFYLDGGFLVLRREILQQVGLMDENLFLDGEDYDWCLRMKRVGWKVYYTTQTRVVHGMHASKDSCRDAMFVQWFKSYLYLTRKNRGEFSYHILRAGTIAGMLTRLMVACLKAPFVDSARTLASTERSLLTIRMCIEFRPLDCLKGLHEQQQRARMLGWQKLL